MDAFYASIELRDHPEYAGKPLVVGRPESRGVVSAASLKPGNTEYIQPCRLSKPGNFARM